MINNIIKLCDLCVKDNEPISLQVYREGEKKAQYFKAFRYEYVEEDGYVLFEINESEEFLVVLKDKNIDFKHEGIEKEEKVFFEISDEVHGKKIYFKIGTESSEIAIKYIKNYR